MAPLKILTLSTVFPNAAEPNFGVFVESQTRHLAARSDVVLRVVSPLACPPFPLGLHPRYRRLAALPHSEEWKGVPVARPRFAVLPGLSGALNPAAIDRAVRPVLARLREEGFSPDVIDAEFFYPDGPAAARLAAALGVPFSIKARGADIHYWGARPACRRLILDAARRAGGLLAVASSLKRDMAALGIEEASITVHYTGVDLAQFQPTDRSAAKAALGVTGPLVVSLGALIPRKGHATVVEAMRAVPDATVLVVGAGPERDALERLIAARGLGGRVRLLGSVPHAKLPAILGAADVMALASSSEGLANAWVEAMACGTPVVAPAVDGAAEAIPVPQCGRLITERTPQAVADAIQAILADPPPARAVRANAERFTWARNTATLFEHLSAIVAAARSRRDAA
jgi:glycosyltransferase involved in cell wall biosynthesis